MTAADGARASFRRTRVINGVTVHNDWYIGTWRNERGVVVWECVHAHPFHNASGSKSVSALTCASAALAAAGSEGRHA